MDRFVLEDIGKLRKVDELIVDAVLEERQIITDVLRRQKKHRRDIARLEDNITALYILCILLAVALGVSAW